MAARKKAKKAPVRRVRRVRKKALPRKTDIQKKKGPGRKPFKPTDEQRAQVKMLIGLGLTYREIASVILSSLTAKGISVNTLQKHFAAELEDGSGFVKSRITHSLFRKACGDSPQAAICAMFIMKCRFGWRQEDKIIHEIDANTGVLIAPALMTPEDWIKQAQDENAKKKPPTND